MSRRRRGTQAGAPAPRVDRYGLPRGRKLWLGVSALYYAMLVMYATIIVLVFLRLAGVIGS